MSNSGKSFDGVLKRAMRSTTGRESTTFGFSILVTVTFGLTQAVEGSPTVPDIFLYATGAVLSFTVLEGVLSRGFRDPLPQHRTEVLTIGTSLNLLSVIAGMGSGLLIATLFTGGWAWVIAPFAATLVYLLLESAETALGERIRARQGDPHAEEVAP
ncbi:MAG TPA: hypothetical protein DCR63_08015 [Microbacterium sp.]|nr:hypothetical protein [Microbacterium sp.]